jgi:hypothetical protein
LLFISSASRKAKQNTTGSSGALKGKFGIRLMKFACDTFPPVLIKSLGVLLSQFLSGVTNFILVWKSVIGIIAVRLLRFYGPRRHCRALHLESRGLIYNMSFTVIRVGPGAFYTCFLEKLEVPMGFCLELSRSSNGFFKLLLNPCGGFTSETAARRFQKLNGRYLTVSGVKRLQIYNGFTACDGHSPTNKSVRSGVTVV